MKMSELESRCALAYKYEVVSCWRDRRTRIYLWVKNYAFPFIPHRRACLLLAICNRRLLFRIAPVRCLCACNIFGQRHPALVTPALKATPHAAYAGCVPSRMPRACPCPTKKSKHRNILQSNDTRDTLLLHKARTKVHASSMPMHSWHHVINNKTLHLPVVPHAVEVTTQETHCHRTRHVPRRVPRPCPCTASIM